MDKIEFTRKLSWLTGLTFEQRKILRDQLDATDDIRAPSDLVERTMPKRPACPHCGAAATVRWGVSHGLARWRCKSCKKTFNALTGTPLAGLRLKLAWLDYGSALADGLSIRKAASRCEVANSTAFRWRHRFLRIPAWDSPSTVKGIVEVDETFFLESFKGKRELPRPPRKRGGVAEKRGLSREQIPVVTIRDRHGATIDQVVSGIGEKQIGPVLRGVVPKDAILCSDGARSYRVYAARHQIEHHPVKAKPGERVQGAWHIQNVNAYHSRLKGWMRRFRGVATANLQNYLGWRRLLERHGASTTAEICLLSALGRKINS